MSFFFRPFFLSLLLVMLWTVGWVPELRAQNDIIKIGVLSPVTRGLSDIGTKHEESVRLAFGSGQTIEAGGRAYSLEPVYRDTRGENATCREVARSLVEEHSVVAIIGPVKTDCAREILGLDLGVPLVSGLATATSLTRPDRDPWFFRTVPADNQRVRELKNYLTAHEGDQADSEVILFDESNAYSVGLRENLLELYGDPESRPMSFSINDAIERASPDGSIALSRAFLDALPRGRVRVYFFGSGPEALVALSMAMASAGASLQPAMEIQPVFVGITSEVEERAPFGSLAIGEPSIRTEDVEDERYRTALEGYADTYGGLDASFVLTAWEAALFVVPKAVETALKRIRSAGGELSLLNLREQTRECLNQGEFESVTPAKVLSFQEGDRSSPETLPIVKVTRTFVRQNADRRARRIGVGAPASAFLLQAPVRISLTDPYEENETVRIWITRRDAEGDTIVLREEVKMKEGAGSFRFFPGKRGTYSVTLPDHRESPTEILFRVTLGFAYLIAAVAALVGAFLGYMSEKEKFIPRMVTGFLVGGVLTLFALILPNAGVLKELPVMPSLGDPAWVNAMWIGFFGGLLGFDGLKLIPKLKKHL